MRFFLHIFVVACKSLSCRMDRNPLFILFQNLYCDNDSEFIPNLSGTFQPYRKPSALPTTLCKPLVFFLFRIAIDFAAFHFQTLNFLYPFCPFIIYPINFTHFLFSLNASDSAFTSPSFIFVRFSVSVS